MGCIKTLVSWTPILVGTWVESLELTIVQYFLGDSNMRCECLLALTLLLYSYSGNACTGSFLNRPHRTSQRGLAPRKPVITLQSRRCSILLCIRNYKRYVLR